MFDSFITCARICAKWRPCGLVSCWMWVCGLCRISGSHGSKYEDGCILGCCVVLCSGATRLWCYKPEDSCLLWLKSEVWNQVESVWIFHASLYLRDWLFIIANVGRGWTDINHNPKNKIRDVRIGLVQTDKI